MKRFNDWIVDDRGLYNETMEYLIPVKDICEVRHNEISEWALHMIEKTWVEPEEFVPAFKYALTKFKCSKIDWGKTLKALQMDAYEELVTSEAYRRLKIDRTLGITGETGAALMKEVARLKSFAWRPRDWTSRDIKAKRATTYDQ